MTSSISSMLNSRLRMNGMVSGLDTDSIVKKLMAADQAKLDKLKGNKQSIEWKKDAYRDITSLLKGFSSQYFDLINPATNLRSESAFSGASVKYNGTDTSEYFSVVCGANAKPGNYTISNITLAEQAKLTSSAAAGGVKSDTLTAIGINAISDANDNNRVTVTLNGVSKDIVLSDNPADITALKNDLQQKIDAAFGLNPDLSKKITVGIDAVTNANLTFSSDTTNTFSIGYANNYGYRDIFTKSISSGITFTNQNNKFNITLGTVTKQFELPAGAVYTNGDDLADAVQGLVDDPVNGFGADKVRIANQGGKIVMKAVGALESATGALSGITLPTGSSKITIDGSNNSMSVTIGGVTKTITLSNSDYTRQDLLAAIQSKIDSSFGTNKGIVSANGSSLRFESVSATQPSSASAAYNKGLEAIGMNAVNQSNKISTTAKLYDIKDNFATPLTLGSGNTTISFTINGSTFSFDSRTTSLNSIISKVNDDPNANVKMSYDELNNSILIQSKTAGATSSITTSDISGGFLTSLNLVASNVAGKDASVTINDGVNGDQTIIRSSNTFTVNGMQFELKKTNTTTPVTLSVTADSNKIFDLIKGFVTKYNDVVGKINTELSEKKFKGYLPLTEEQRAAMKEEDIKLWEDKAKSGILRGEDTLKNVVDNLRKVLYDPIYTDASDNTTKLSQSLYSIGITTGAYQDQGKLVINEAKLRDAILKKPDQVVKLFTADSSVSYSEAMDDSAAKSQRYKETGLANRLYDVLQDNIRTMRNANGKKGILLEKAGMDGDLTDVHNTFATEIASKQTLIDTLTEKMIDKEDAYYKKFSMMETAMSKMNSQSSWLSQQFGGR